MRTPRVRKVKGVLWFILGVAAVVATARLLAGLGTVTNLTDRTPWGLWVGFDVLGGVALAAGGFVIAGIVYCMRQERFRPLLRPAVLTAFLGYVAVAVGLMIDIGRPWNIWRPMFFWQHHSVLFEVAWCVMLYTTVLLLEFLPVPLESSRFHGIAKFLKRWTLPLVVLGIMLSTLHQSSLGSLFLLTPGRVHPLWYSPLLPLLFFVSAVGLGLAMVTFESKATSWLYGRPPEDKLLSRLAKPMSYVLLLYAAIRLVDLGVRGKLGFAFDGSWEAALFWFEMVISAFLPAALVLGGAVGRSGRALTWAAGLVVVGFVLHRIDTGGVSGITRAGAAYFPSWEEVVISLGVVSAAVLVFLFFVERFRVYEEPPKDEVAPEGKLPARYAYRRFLPPLAIVRSSSFLFVVGAALAFALLPGGAVSGADRVELDTPVEGSRRILAFDQSGKEVFLIDGNRANEVALFPHAEHAKRQGPERCNVCHHMNRPNDRASSCYECHRDQYKTTDIFRHDYHADLLGGNAGCSECHKDPSLPKTRANSTPCLDCHRDMVAGGGLVDDPAPDSPFAAVSYMEAMHGTCLKCHVEEDEKHDEKLPKRALCSTCHPAPRDLRPRVPEETK
jgi:Ni/Fe-hydrogenase subunit HybB-like protein